MRFRPVVTRFAAIVCPPGVAEAGRMDATLREFELMLASLAPSARHTVPLLFAVLDQGARLHPSCRGRSLHTADPDAAARYLTRLITARSMLGELTRRLKSVVVMCYYEQPDVKREIGYLPDPYIATVTRRRLERYGDQIAAKRAGAKQAGAKRAGAERAGAKQAGAEQADAKQAEADQS